MTDRPPPHHNGATRPAARYRVRGPQVIHEIIDGEVVIINLESGNYYSLRGSGARVWSAIAGLARAEEIVADLARGDERVGEVGASVAAFLAELEAEGLVAPSPDGQEPAAAWEPDGAVQGPYQAPVLERFTDMQDLILLDPVHEVDEAEGWPRPKPAP